MTDPVYPEPPEPPDTTEDPSGCVAFLCGLVTVVFLVCGIVAAYLLR